MLYFILLFARALMLSDGIKASEMEVYPNVRMDSTAVHLIDKKTVFWYCILSETQGVTDTIYKQNVVNYSIQASMEFEDESMLCFTFYSLPDGSKLSVLYDKRNESFYKTERYNRNATSDEIDRASLDFSNLKAGVIRGDMYKLPYYEIALEKLE